MWIFGALFVLAGTVMVLGADTNIGKLVGIWMVALGSANLEARQS